MEHLEVSVVIPVKAINDYLRKETIPALLKQTYSNFEVIILPDRKSSEIIANIKIVPSWPETGPAQKRDLGANKARGKILAFLDDDSYPDKNWLKNALNTFKEEKTAAAVCGPSLTPPDNNLKQKASGYVWSSWLGSGGAGTNRCSIGETCQVDDFPTVNLFVIKKDFWQAGGFDCNFYPGEDTKLCLELTKRLKKNIIYSPKIIVYHHRREIFGPHLKQIGRYAIHRGYFAKKFPETSFRIGYFIPTFFFWGIVLGPIFYLLLNLFQSFYIANIIGIIYLFCIIIYLGLVFYTCINVWKKERSYKLLLLVSVAILSTHLWYGLLFTKGYLIKNLEK